MRPTSLVTHAHQLSVGALDCLPDRVAVLNARGEVIAVNRSWREAYADEDPETPESSRALAEIAAGSLDSYDCVYATAAATPRWIAFHAACFDASGERCVVVVHQDVTARHEAEQLSRTQDVLLGAVDAAIIATDLTGTITHWSQGAERLQGWTAAEVLGKPLGSVNTLEGEGDSSTDAILAGLRDRGEWDGEIELSRSDGSTVLAYIRDRLVFDGEGRPNQIVGVAVDITERVETETKLREALDFITTVARAMPNGLIVVDGDDRTTLANEAAEAMLGWPPGELLGKPLFDLIGGSMTAVTDAASRADDVFERRDGSLLAVEYSLAPLPAGPEGAGRVLVFSDITERRERELRVQEELEAISWVTRIRDALDQDRFVLYAQPIVDLATGDSVQHELLVRMVELDGTVIAPGVFLPVAEQHGLIKAIDRRVIEKAMAYARAGKSIEINVSAESISDPATFEFVKHQLQAAGVRPELVVFELTETSLIQNEGVAQTFIAQVRDLGCGVALDDFGTGYASFRYLKHLAVDVLKIDQEFIRDLDQDAGQVNAHVIRAIVALARGMGQKTVGEGVETGAALIRLRELGVDFAQGYYFARPAPADDVLGAGE